MGAGQSPPTSYLLYLVMQLIQEAEYIVVKCQLCTPALLQRSLKVTYKEALVLIQQLRALEVITNDNQVLKRPEK